MSLRRDLELGSWCTLEMSSIKKYYSLASKKYHLKYKQSAIASVTDSF